MGGPGLRRFQERHHRRAVLVAFTAFSPIRANDPAAVAEVAAANCGFDAARAAGLPEGDQPGNYYNKGYRPGGGLDLARAAGWSAAYILPNGGHDRPGHPEAPDNNINAAFFAEQLFGAERGLETPDIATTVNGTTLDVTVTFPDSGVPDDNWTTMTGTGSTWTASIPLEPGRTSIDLVTTHTVTVDGNTIPISAPYARVALD